MDKINAFRGKYFFLSNFYNVPVTYKGVTYQNNEAAFQAQKLKDPSQRKQFASLNPSQAKKLGRKVSLRPDWEDIKVDRMTEIIRMKFDQNPELKKQLLKTDGIYLEEGNTWGDRIWGTVDGKGQNLLGRILMDLRDDYVREPASKDISMDTAEMEI